MRKYLYIILAAAFVCACEKAVTIDHHISAEFPVTETLQDVSILFAEEGEADILVTSSGVQSALAGVTETAVTGGRIVRYKSLALFSGTLSVDLLEKTFWADPSKMWLYRTYSADAEEVLAGCGFVNVLRARGLDGETVLYASSNAYDKISSLSGDPLGFNIKVKEAAQ